MIPNAGLDNIAAYSAWQHLTGALAPTSGQDWLGYAAISEDSQEPLATDVNIGAEKARTNSTGGFNRTATAIRDPNTNRVGVSIERAYVFGISSAMNITKYGYVPVSSGGNFSWIDLVRSDPNDPQSSPIPLTLEPGDQLQLWCTLTVTVPWSVGLEPFVIAGTLGNDTNGTHDAYCGFFAADDTLTGSSGGIADTISRVFWPNAASPMYATPAPSVSASRDAGLTATTSGQAASASNPASYASGTYYRDKACVWSTASGNMNASGFALPAGTGASRNVTNPHGFKVALDNPSTFTKANTHELTLTFRVSWQEA